MDEATMVQLIAFTIALVEGFKQIGLAQRFYVLATIVTGMALASVAEFTPDVWERVIPILTVGLAAAGLYSLGKRAGGAVFNTNKEWDGWRRSIVLQTGEKESE